MFRRALLLTAICLSACTTAQSKDTHPAIKGGVEADGIYAVLGVEYATAERWQLPENNAEWEAKGDFSSFGPACPQKGQVEMVEDCLFLNVFTPDVITDDDMPVLVWFHGGGFIAGEGGGGPKAMARDGMVVVTFNYRLGKLGFHDWAGWDKSDPRNFGQADMVAALDWVQANIGRLGGDPDNVTIAGHSAGGMGVQLMMVDPRAEGKFARAWSHAGYGSWPFRDAYNPSPEERARIRYSPLETDRTAEALVGDVSHYLVPYTDAPFLKRQPTALFERGETADIPYVAGANSYDGAGTLQGAGFTPESFLSKIDSPAIRDVYAEDFAVSDLQAAQRIFGDLRYLLSSAETAHATDGWLFHYDDIQNGQPGAFHGQQYDRLFGEKSFAMREAMLSFIKSGEPGWPRLDQGTYARFSPGLSTEDISKIESRLNVLADHLDRVAP